MLKGRGRDPRVNASKVPAHLAGRSPAQAQGVRQPAHNPTHLTIRTPSLPRAPLAKPEPDYEVVEFPSEQYVNAKLQPPPPPPPRPPTGHPAEAASCGLCGGGGARVRCTECGRRALCASCDDMYHRHPKRRHHQRQALSLNQIRDDPRPPLPPKGTPPVPPPRRHKISGDRMSASPRPPSADSRNMTLASHPVVHTQTMPLNNRMASQTAQQIPAHLQRLSPAAAGGHLGSMPYLPAAHHAAPAPPGTLGHLAPGWQRPRTSLPGFNMPPNVPMAPEAWESPDNMVTQSWGRPLRRGASVLELGGGMGVGMGSAGGVCGAGGACAGGQCGWRYGSCASLDHQAWPAPAWPAPCCHPPVHPHAHMHAPYTPQPYRRADSRAASRVASRAGSRAASPAMSVRSRASRRTKHRTPSPPPLPSSDADSESDSEPERPPPKEQLPSHPPASMNKPITNPEERAGPAAARAPWQCEHCTFVNEPGVRVCAVCCRTPTAAPRELPAHDTPYDNTERTESPSVLDSARSVAKSARGLERLDLRSPERLDLRSPERLDLRSPERLDLRSPKRLDLRSPDPPPPAAAPAPAAQQRTQQNGETSRAATKKERISTGCGPSPPREDNVRKYNNRLVTPTREQSVDSTRTRHDMAVGASPPREVQSRASVAHSPPRQSIMRASPFREPAKQHETPTRHSISVGPSPPRENSVRSSPVPIQKKSAGTSPPRDRDNESRASSTLVRTTVSNTGTSPPPQSISTQTYEVPNAWERAPSAARTRSRRRLRDDARRERSHSRHSLSSDTRESERTSGGGGGGSSGRWEWRSGRSARDSSPGAEWSGSERRPPPRLARRASHLDLRRDARAPPRRASFYRDEAASPEPTRAMSLETLATATGANAAAASRGLELARLMADAERLGFSAAEVQAALAQSPAAPLAWLRERWPSLCAGVRAAAARLAPRARVTELEARAALARHRGAMWPAVTDCVERHRRQAEKESGTRQHGGRVWGSPAGADDDAAPPRGLREDSSDEFDGPPPTDFRDDDWMYLPLDVCAKGRRESISMDEWDVPPADFGYREVASDVALELSRLLVQAGVPATTDNLMLNNLLSNAEPLAAGEARNVGNKQNSIDLIQSENDFIDAYNALTRSTPLPTVDNRPETVQTLTEKDPKRDMYDVNENHSHLNIENTSNKAINNIPVMHIPETLTVPSVQSSVIQNKQSQDISNIINGHVQHGDGETSTVLINKQNSNPSTEVSNSPIQFTNTPMDDRGDNRQINENIEQTFIDNFGESLPSISAIASNVKDSVNVKGDNNPRPDQNVNQGLEKSSSNLNDIVGNTQRLIQQMKDEINSDINYIDSKNKSQSEADSSSNESDISSEHESSYSDTEDKETDDLSSDESETLSTDNEAEHLHERRPTIIHRTSSEENDQFEEAMDHIEDQMEDFKNTNIEILDSIARSLQEEHTISVEVSEPIITNDKRQDLNNNLFVEVNSFEEIYAELNTNKKETPNQKIISKIQNDNPNANSSQKAEINIAAQDKTVSNPNATTLIERIILEDKPNLPNESTEKNFEKPIHTDHIPDKVEEVTNNLPYEENNESAVDSSSNSSDEESDSLNSADSDITPTDQNILTNTDVKSITENMNNLQLSTENTFIQNTEADNLVEQNVSREIMEEIIAIENTHQHIEIEEDSSEEFKTVEDDIEQTTIVENISDENISPNIAEQHFNIEDGIEQNITIENDNKLNIGVTETTETPIIARKNNIAETIAIVENGYEQSNPITEQKSTTTENIATENNQEENIVTVNHNDQQNNDNVVINTINETTDITNQEIKVEIKKEVAVSEERRKSLSKSPPKSPTDAAGTNKTFIANKSNIPKLVKVLPNNKQKADKTSSKVVASKVPVRRASLKQYPAPTPPKTHFGNVQSGHVKQLQTRLFNNKFPKTVVNVPDVVDVKPSTSTIHKKKPAPPPPTTNQKQPPLTKTSPPKEKKNSFFRESCRTEDEWTESDAEDTPLPPPRENQEPNRAPSPPPPVTVRRVSGQIIDLARVRLPEGSPERQARMLLAEGATETWEQARLAVELVSRGAEPPAALLAALECADLSAALAYLHQDCELCAERLPEHEMVSMLRCTHRCCRECARLYFTVQITERSIADCVCPYCKEPDLENTPEDAWFEYFAHLDILLKTLLETDVHELFQRKLRDRTLARDPNFRWCMECSSGFFVHPKQKKIRCPECRSVSCAKCRKAWSVNHEGLSCEQYAAWLDDNDPERSIAAVQQHLRENGLECPRCRFKYSLSRGGCMHFTCTQCKYEFCYGCGKPFMMGARCGLSEYCAKLGLHAHHPRNCLFYLRDKEPHELQTLLQMNNVAYETEAPEGSTNRCPIQLQRETPTGLVDGICGNETPPTYAGLCKPHYVEYLAARARALDPIPIMDVSELVAELRRRALPLPERGPWDTDPIYAGMCAEIVKEKIPLD